MVFDDQKASLNWPVLYHRGVYTAYILERSANGKSFQPLTDLPYVSTSDKMNPEFSYYVDSLPANHQTFYYRIRGITPFGEKGPYSEVVSGKGHAPLDGLVSIDSSFAIDNNRILLSWSVPADYTKLLKGYFVQRAIHPDGPYATLTPKILPTSQTSFTDITAKTNNYYRIKYLSKEQDREYFSFPYLAQLMDTIPPSPPLEIAGKIDTTGIVSLSWKKNPEEDVLGYRVFRSNSLNEEFAEQTSIILKNPTFKDTVNIQTLTKKVFYKIVAVDRYYNPSEYSLPFTLARPDVIAPVPPVFVKAGIKDSKIELEWETSVSKDISKYILYRKKQGKDSLQNMKEWKSSEDPMAFTDSTAALGLTYQYVLIARDSAGNEGKVISRPIYFETGMRKQITEIKTNINRTTKEIELAWKYDLKNVSKILIYKYKEGEPIKIYQTLSSDVFNFKDKDLSINNTYIYKIKAVFKGGVQSEMSEEIKVKF